MTTSRKVLIVDDDADYVRAIRHLLEQQGDTVLSASNGSDGIAVARQSRPDVILLDVMMSERTEGFFTLDRLKRECALSEIPVIVVSSIYAEYPRFKVNPQAGWLPADAFLAKPVAPQQLLDQIARVVDAAKHQVIGSTRR